MGLWSKFISIAVGVDDTVSAAEFSTGDDITISSRSGMAVIDKARGVPATPEQDALVLQAEALNKIQPGHCNGAIFGDIKRAKDVVALLQPYADYITANNLPTNLSD